MEPNDAVLEDEGRRISPAQALRTAFRQLPPQRRRRLWSVFVLMAVAALFDAVGVTAVLPLAAALVVAGEPQGGVLGVAFASAAWLRDRDLVPVVAAALFLLFALKAALQYWIIRVQVRFALDEFTRAAARLFDAYMRASWRAHARRSSSQLLRNTTMDTREVYVDLVMTALGIGTHALGVGAVLLALLAVDPRAVIVSALLCAFVGATSYLALRRSADRAARGRRAAKAEMIRWVADGLACFKEARVFEREAFFVSGLRGALERFADTELFSTATRRLPRLLAETAAVGCVAASIAFIARFGGDEIAWAPVIAAFGVALARLVPGVQSIASDLLQLRRAAPAAIVFADVEVPSERPGGDEGPTVAFRREVRLERVSVRYPHAQAEALVDVSLRIEPGEWVALVGPSGAGKTTVADVVLGLVDPDRGALLVDGVAVGEGARSWRAQLAYIPQRPHVLDDTVRNNVAFGSDVSDEQVWRALEQAQLASTVRAHPGGLDARIGEHGRLISGGELQRIAVARALVRQPRLLVLDEATSALDRTTEIELVEALRRLPERPALVMIAHRLATARSCDRLVVLDHGRVVAAGTWDEVVASAEARPLLPQ